MALKWARRSFTAVAQPASVAVALAISTQAVGIAAAAARFVGLDERLPVLPEEGRATRDCRKQQHDFGRLLSTTNPPAEARAGVGVATVLGGPA